jgi:hypothetical protein
LTSRFNCQKQKTPQHEKQKNTTVTKKTYQTSDANFDISKSSFDVTISNNCLVSCCINDDDDLAVRGVISLSKFDIVLSPR